MNRNNFYNRRHRRPFFLLFILIALFIVSVVVMLLWNLVVPEITGWKSINYGQSIGLVVLFRLLTGRIGPAARPWGRPPFGFDRFREKYRDASPEERQAMREEWSRRCRARKEQQD